MTDTKILLSMVVIGSLSVLTFGSILMQITIHAENADFFEMLYLSLYYYILREVGLQVYDEFALWDLIRQDDW